MDICNSGHKEIVYTDRECPVCKLMDVLRVAKENLSDYCTDNPDAPNIDVIEDVISEVEYVLR
jgi:hypothetical protein